MVRVMSAKVSDLPREGRFSHRDWITDVPTEPMAAWKSTHCLLDICVAGPQPVGRVTQFGNADRRLVAFNNGNLSAWRRVVLRRISFPIENASGAICA